jgi:hypothetical protein
MPKTSHAVWMKGNHILLLEGMHTGIDIPEKSGLEK